MSPLKELSVTNYQNQLSLLHTLRNRFNELTDNGVNKTATHAIATSLGITIIDFINILNGEVDLTLTNLRELALALNVTISYTVNAETI